MFPVDTGDTVYKLARNRRIRAEHKRNCRSLGLPCARCRGLIDYDALYWLPPDPITGRRKVNPVAYVAGHRIAHADGGPYTLANLQPECGRCSSHSGAQSGNQRQRAAARRAPLSGPTLVDDDW
jgi:hypothetical protein